MRFKIIILSLAVSLPAFADTSFIWKAAPGGGAWSTGSNWVGGVAPNGASDVAVFDTTSVAGVSVNNTQVSGIVFNNTTSAYTITVLPAAPGSDALTISGAGITNNSGITQNFVTEVNGIGQQGFILFQNSATAGSLTAFANKGSITIGENGGGTQFFNSSTAGSATFTNYGGAVAGAFIGFTQFKDSSTAGTGTFINKASTVSAGGGETDFQNFASAQNGTFTNEGGKVSGRQGGYVQFFDNSTAANGTFTTNGGTVSGALGGAIVFYNSATAASGTFTADGGTTTGAGGGIVFFTNTSTAANATLTANGGTGGGDGGLLWFKDSTTGSTTTTVKVYGNGGLDISQLALTGLTVGSIEGDGNIFLGSKQLTEGGNGQTTTFGGVIKDGGLGGGAGGSLVKNGTGTLTLTGTNTCTGATTVSGGTLQVSGGGSITQTSSINVDGTLADNPLLKVDGTTGGSVTSVGSATVGDSGTGTLTVQNGGVVAVAGGVGTVTLARNAGSTGTLNIGASGGGTTAGTLNAGVVNGGAGTAVINFNQTNSTSFAPQITGSTAVKQLGTGTTLLTAASTYAGTTDVNAGALVVNGSLTGGAAVTVDSGATLAGTGAIAPAVGQSIFINGTLNVGDPTVPATASVLALTTSGAGSVVMGTGSFIHVNLLTGAGLGDNSATSSAADVLSLHGPMNATAGGTLVIGNPNHMTAFAGGDQWKVLELNSADPNPGSVTGTLAVNDSSLALATGMYGSFNQTTGIYSIVDLRPQLSAVNSGLPIAMANVQALIGAGQTVLNDINGHLFNLRAGGGEEEEADGSIGAALDVGVIVGQGDGDPGRKSPVSQGVPRSRQWEIFTTVNYGNVNLRPVSTQAGVQLDAWASSLGIERHFSRSLTLGFAVSFLQSTQTYSGGLGHMHLEGPALSAYVSFVRKNFWSSLLYSFGAYELDTTRNPGFAFPQAFGSTHTYTHAIQYNTGWNFRFQNNTLVTGPFVGVDYLHGTVEGYSETGGGLAALSYGRQNYQSLVSRVGWSASKKLQTDWALITPQVRLSYERQNIHNNNGTSVALINAPFGATGGSQSPGQSYLVVGAGVNFQFNDRLSLLLSYQGQFFRQDMQAHFGSVRLSYKF